MGMDLKYYSNLNNSFTLWCILNSFFPIMGYSLSQVGDMESAQTVLSRPAFSVFIWELYPSTDPLEITCILSLT